MQRDNANRSTTTTTIWYPVTKKNKQAIENLQRRATKIVPEIKDLSYEERLRELNLPVTGKGMRHAP